MRPASQVSAIKIRMNSKPNRLESFPHAWGNGWFILRQVDGKVEGLNTGTDSGSVEELSRRFQSGLATHDQKELGSWCSLGLMTL